MRWPFGVSRIGDGRPTAPPREIHAPGRGARGRIAEAEVLPAEILRQVRRLEIRTRAAVSELFTGQYHSVFKGQGMEFAEVREYVAGDDIRTIDWNVTARYGTPFVRKYVEERELTVFLAVDVSGSLDFGSAGRSKVELAAEVAALLAFSAIGNHDKVGLLTFTERPELYIPPRKDRGHGLRLIREILYHRPGGRGTDLAAACEAARHALRRRSVIFLLSDFLVPVAPLDAPLGALARKHDVIAIEIRDPLETIAPCATRRSKAGSIQWPRLGLIEWKDPETGRTTLFDTSDGAARRRLGSRFAEQRAAVAGVLRRHGVDQVTLQVGSDPIEPLLAFFRLRERRRARE